jgi:hypothetical protein
MWASIMLEENGGVGHDPNFGLASRQCALQDTQGRSIKIKDLCYFLSALLTPVTSLFLWPTLTQSLLFSIPGKIKLASLAF